LIPYLFYLFLLPSLLVIALLDMRLPCVFGFLLCLMIQFCLGQVDTLLLFECRLTILIAAQTLIEKHHAKAIIGFRAWQKAVFVAQLGNKSQVHIVSLSNEAPPLASCQWPFLVSAARSIDSHMKVVAAIIHSWQWQKVNIIYEDFNLVVRGITLNIITAIQEVNAEINDLLPLSPFSPYPSISEKLESLKNGQCRVIIVHTSIT
jgi:hypothetical protein